MEKFTNDTPDFFSFGLDFPDGRLVEPGHNIPSFSFKAVYAETVRLGRPLTDEEFEKFVAHEEDLIPA